MDTLTTTTVPGPVDPDIQVIGYVQGEQLYHQDGQPALRTLRVHATGSLWPLELDEWSVAAALHAADAETVVSPETDLDELAALVLRGVQLAGWLRVGTVGWAAADVWWRLDHHDQPDTEVDIDDQLMAVEAWGSDEHRRTCHALARVLCESEHTELLREVPGHGHCPTLAEIATGEVA
jgi:hypothetical protein